MRFVVLVLAAIFGVLVASASSVSSDAGAETLVASCYGDELAGSPTATGEPFDPAGLTAASPYLPFGTVVAVTSWDTGATVNVRINDRGPYVAGRQMDLSCGAMGALGLYPGVYAVEAVPLY